MNRILLSFLAALLVLPFWATAPAEAQYFGRNKVQFETFDFRILESLHFDIYFYDDLEDSIEDVARLADRWYERAARIFSRELDGRRPLIFYANHPHFQQTNVLPGQLGEGVGGVAEGLRNRIIMPVGSSWGDTDHVLGHEIVHAFQFDVAGRRAGLQGLMRLPLWFVEGQPEYLSLGGHGSHTAMWIRDALLRDEFPTMGDLSRNQMRYFPYRFGHAWWAWVSGRWGDEVNGSLLRVAVESNIEAAVRQVLGMSSDTLSALWKEESLAHFGPLMEGRTPPQEAGTLLLSPATGAGRQNLAPALSPDGRYIAFLSEKDLFTIEIFLADARTGRVLRRITSSVRDAHLDALRFLDSAAAWWPDGEHLAVVVFSQGRNQIQLYRARDGRPGRLLRVPEEIGEVRSPAFSPDGRSLVFSGKVRGTTDLFRKDLASGEVTRLTDTRYSAMQPAFSPDGRLVAFVTDEGPDTNFDRLTFGPPALMVLDLETGERSRLAPLGQAEHWNPVFAPDGQSLYFLADPDGFRDLYRLDRSSGELRRVTNLATGVSGITAATPALSVALETESVAFSVFDGGEYHVFGLDAAEAVGEPVRPAELLALDGSRLPGAPPRSQGQVGTLLAEAETGLVGPGVHRPAEARAFQPSLGLEWIGQPTIGAGVDQFGTFISGMIAAQFADMLGNRRLFTAVQAQGEVQDVGGQVFYSDMERRWNWGVGASHLPTRYVRGGFDQDGAQTFLVQDLFRIRQTQALGQIQYPFSQIRRFDFAAGFNRFDYSAERRVYPLDALGRITGEERRSLASPDALNLAQASVAFVEDNAFFAFVSPVRGWRARYELSQTVGSVSYTQATLDHRRYLAPHQNLTLAVRGLHLGRYGVSEADQQVLRPFFLGWEAFIRGYSPQSFQPGECTDAGHDGCPEFDRLLGQRIGVVNLEARIPLLGTDRFGLINFGYLPTELVFFTDAGVAWSAGDGAELRFERTSPDRIPVFSSGVSARMNILGALILEAYYAQPWQRPGRGWHWGFNLAPGW